MDESGKPVNALENVKKEWKAFQEGKNEWWIISLVDGQRKLARILHPRLGEPVSSRSTMRQRIVVI